MTFGATGRALRDALQEANPRSWADARAPSANQEPRTLWKNLAIIEREAPPRRSPVPIVMALVAGRAVVVLGYVRRQRRT
jgi:hypothetical protein